MTALNGIRVLDLTRLLPGAVATQWLADFGAEVIKIEQPKVGDYARQSHTGVFEFTNRGKKSVEIDLKEAAGKAAFLKLAGTADVVIEGFRPDVMGRLGVGFDVLIAQNPRLIYCALTGYGIDTEFSDLAGHDINYLALAGVLDLMGSKDGPPALAGIQIADLAGGSMQAVIGILLALEARHRTGRGQRVDISMFAGSAAMMTVPLALLNSGRRPQRGNDLLSGRYACYQIYAAAGGSYVAVGALEPKFWSNLCRELGRQDLIEDQFAEGARQDEIKAAMASEFLKATAEEWFERIGRKDCCVTPVRHLRDALRGAYPSGPIPPLSDTPGRREGRAPVLGEHNQEMLGEHNRELL
ncbi:MAG TPA: CaiB/BaiF CoA-transferase family protein [Bryobacteraceae bacterium]|nr:CaiB/BaiF CoA-transferase family protein [Bryobacteraceae bacterium]